MNMKPQETTSLDEQKRNIMRDLAKRFWGTRNCCPKCGSTSDCGECYPGYYTTRWQFELNNLCRS